jgi:hypothetical protein
MLKKKKNKVRKITKRNKKISISPTLRQLKKKKKNQIILTQTVK